MRWSMNCRASRRCDRVIPHSRSGFNTHVGISGTVVLVTMQPQLVLNFNCVQNDQHFHGQTKDTYMYIYIYIFTNNTRECRLSWKALLPSADDLLYILPWLIISMWPLFSFLSHNHELINSESFQPAQQMSKKLSTSSHDPSKIIRSISKYLSHVKSLTEQWIPHHLQGTTFIAISYRSGKGPDPTRQCQIRVTMCSLHKQNSTRQWHAVTGPR